MYSSIYTVHTNLTRVLNSGIEPFWLKLRKYKIANADYFYQRKVKARTQILRDVLLAIFPGY